MREKISVSFLKKQKQINKTKQQPCNLDCEYEVLTGHIGKHDHFMVHFATRALMVTRICVFPKASLRFLR